MLQKMYTVVRRGRKEEATGPQEAQEAPEAQGLHKAVRYLVCQSTNMIRIIHGFYDSCIDLGY